MTHHHGLVLAAGAGRRFGGGKLLTPWRGRPLIHWSIAAAFASGVDAVTVVLGADADRLAACLDPSVTTVVCTEWDEGIAASLRCGVAALPEGTSAALIFLGDMPDIPPSLGRSLLDLVAQGAPAALAHYGDTPAHPVAISPSVVPLLMTLRGDQGARTVLAGMAGVCRIATRLSGSIFDVDYKSDVSVVDRHVRNAE